MNTKRWNEKWQILFDVSTSSPRRIRSEIFEKLVCAGKLKYHDEINIIFHRVMKTETRRRFRSILCLSGVGSRQANSIEPKHKSTFHLCRDLVITEWLDWWFDIRIAVITWKLTNTGTLFVIFPSQIAWQKQNINLHILIVVFWLRLLPRNLYLILFSV